MTTDPYQVLMSSALRFLSIRPRSRKEIEEFLKKKILQKKISSDISEQVLIRLEEMDYINDKKFTRAFVSSAVSGKPKGPATIRFQLKQKGISEEIIQSVLSETDEISNEESQIDLGKKALGKKGELYKKLPVLECKKKVHDYLLRRGFSSQITRQLVDDYCQKAYNKSHEI